VAVVLVPGSTQVSASAGPAATPSLPVPKVSAYAGPGLALPSQDTATHQVLPPLTLPLSIPAPPAPETVVVPPFVKRVQVDEDTKQSDNDSSAVATLVYAPLLACAVWALALL
jgi:hypothetical protein